MSKNSSNWFTGLHVARMQEHHEHFLYHGTTRAAAQSILQNGIDPQRYRSGMFRGFYCTPSLNYFAVNRPEVILTIEVDPQSIMNISDITDEDLAQVDPQHRMMSYGYRNSLIEKLARQRGFRGLRSGNEVILLDRSACLSIKELPQTQIKEYA